jgi:hypothetical protein
MRVCRPPPNHVSIILDEVRLPFLNHRNIFSLCLLWLTFGCSGSSGNQGTDTPSVASVNSSFEEERRFFQTDEIEIQVNFSEAVTVTGSPVLKLDLENDREAIYSEGSGTSALTFVYTVQPDDDANDLDYESEDALTLSGGTITSSDGSAADLKLPTPGATGSLSATSDLKIDTDFITARSFGSFNCVRNPRGQLKCWGFNSFGQLGRGDTTNIGDSSGEM